MIAYLLIILGFTMRLIPHVPNMAPVAAIALFSGCYLNKKISPWVPLAIMIIADLIIGMHEVVLFTWGSFILIGFIGMRLKEKRTPIRILGFTLGGALLFFLITNFGVWMVWYPKTAAGFIDCYVKALPFFRNTMVGNSLFAFVLFGGYELARKLAEGSRFRDLLLVRS